MTDDGSGVALSATSAQPASGQESALSDSAESPGHRYSGSSSRHMTKRSARMLVTQMGREADPPGSSGLQRHAATLSDNPLRDVPRGVILQG